MSDPRQTLKVPVEAIAKLRSFTYAAAFRQGRRVTLGEALEAALDVAGAHLADVDRAIDRTHPAAPEVPK